MINDLRYAARNMLRAPGFTATIVVTLALGIGANTAIFSVVDALLFKPLPYPHADRLYAITLATDKPQGYQYWPYPKYAAFAREQRVFEGTAAYARTELTILVGGQPERVDVEVVSAGYFPLLGAIAATGRIFTVEEEKVPARDAVVVLSDRLWRRAFGTDPNVAERTVTIKDRVYSIVGVMPPSFRGQTGTTELWLPVMMADHFMFKGAATESYGWWMRVLGRLKPEMNEAAANAQMPSLTRRVFELAPSMMKPATRDGRELFQLVPFRAIKVDPDVSRSFVILLAAIGFVLLIACANTASLLLGRAITRQAEFAIRRALGASQSVIVRQVLVESVLLAMVSGGAALIVSMWTLDWLATAKPMNATGFWSQYSRTFDYFTVSLNPRMTGFNFAVALGVGVLFGLLPALHASRVDLNDSLKRRASRGSSQRFNARVCLVVVEIAFSIVLLVSAALMAKSFSRAASTDLGFDPGDIITMSASIEERKPAAFYKDLLDRLSAIPRVQHASLAAGVPIGRGTSGGPIEIEGRQKVEGGVASRINVVSPGFFRTFRIPIITGRVFSDEDRETAPRVAVINRAFARAAWPGQDAIGKRVRHGFRIAYGDPGAWTTIVGVVEDTVYGTLDEPREPMIYLTAWQPLGTPQAISLGPSTIALRTTSETATVVAAVRMQLQALDSNAPVYDIATMSERAAQVTSRYRYSSAMMGAMAALALLLAGIGTYGVIAYSVASRSREISIRIALGAGPRDVVGLVLSEGVRLTAVGLSLGLAGAYAASRFLTSMLYGVAPHDPAAFGGIVVLIAAVSLLACYLPATRAMRADPVVALKSE